MAKYDDLNDYNWLAREILRHEAMQSSVLGQLLYRTFKPKSVIDVGCGGGLYLIPFRPYGVEIFGVDGADGMNNCLAPNEFELADLRTGWTPPRRFDLALNVEVAEHIPAQYERVLVNTLTQCADRIFFSAAHPGQQGDGHCNEKPMSAWGDIFNSFGYRLDEEETAVLHATIDTDEAFEHCGWLRWHSVVFRKLVLTAEH